MKSVLGSWMATASTNFGLRLTHMEWRAAKPSLLEMPFALTDQRRKASFDLVSKFSPLGALVAVRIGGGSGVGVPPGWCVRPGSGPGSAARRESRKKSRHSGFRHPGAARALPAGVAWSGRVSRRNRRGGKDLRMWIYFRLRGLGRSDCRRLSPWSILRW
jgi:hypothetical protein